MRPGTIFCLLGPNGSGKTTTFRCISTLYKPDSGTIRVNGYDTISAPSEVRESIGFLSSENKLSGHQSCAEILELHGRLNGLDEKTIADRMDALADIFDIRAFWEKTVWKYSSGQRQRAALAVSVIHDPSVLLFDEPMMGLDILAAKAVEDFLFAERSRGKTILLSTHSIHEAERLSDRLVLDGTPEDLKERLNTPELGPAFYRLIEEDKSARERHHD